MKLPVIALLTLLAVPAAHAQPVPVGSGVMSFKERLKIGKGCERYTGEGQLVFSVLPDGSFRIQTDAGIFSGAVSPLDEKGRAWQLFFDEPSLALYSLYLQAGANVLCHAAVPISGGEIDVAVLKLNGDGSRAFLKLKTTVFGAGRGKHRVKGKGAFEPGVLPEPALLPILGDPGGGGVRLISPGRLDGSFAPVSP